MAQMIPDGAGDPGSARRRGDSDSQSLSRRFADALRVGDSTRANATLDFALQAGLEPAAVQTRVIAPAMHWIGRIWEEGALSVAEEHLATAVASQALAYLYPKLLAAPPLDGRRVLVAATEGEHHLLGPRMAADALEGAGFDVRFLGADVRASVLDRWLQEHPPVAVAIGLTMPLGNSRLARQLRQVRAFDPSIRLIVGGQGVSPVLRRSPSVTYVPDTEQLAAAVQRAVAEPVADGQSIKLPAGGVIFPDQPEDFADGLLTPQGSGTLEARMIEAAIAAAESTREQVRRAVRLERMASRDPLTDLWNRRAFDERYGEMLRLGSAESPALLLIDIDRFKQINDGLGRAAGDRTLVLVAGCILRTLRPQDFAARYAGDEFAVLLSNTPADEAMKIAERIRRRVQTEVLDPRVSVSIGATTARAASWREGKVSADRALDQAKRRGRNQVVFAATEVLTG